MSEACEAADAAKDVAMETVDDDEKTDEDEVLHECDVYLNRMYDPPDFVGDMYLLQYPLRPSYRPYGDQGYLDRVELKPKSRRLRFVYKLNQNEHYAEEDVHDEKYEQRHTLSSTVVANPACSYAIGVIRQGRLTLTPVRAVNQLRPDFEDFEKLRKQIASTPGLSDVGDPKGDEKKGDANSESGGEEPSEMIDFNPVRVEYHAKGEKEVIAQPDVGDLWKRLDFFDQTSPEASDIYLQHIVFAANEASEAEKQGLTSQDPKLQDLDLDGDHISYVRGLCGQAETRNKLRLLRQKAHQAQNSGLSSYVLSKMPAERQVESILRHYGVISFPNLRKRLPVASFRSISEDALIDMLRSCGVLVCGNWVLKSVLANFEGMEAGARDLLLTMLHRKAGKLQTPEVIKWKSVFEQSVAVETLLEIARSVMDEAQDKNSWRLKAEEDKDFIRRFPAVVSEYEAWLESRRSEVVQAGKPGRGSTQASSASRFRGKLVPEVRECLLSGPKTTEEMKKLVQRKHPTLEIQEEDLLGSLNAKELDAIQVRGVWVLAGTGTESHDKFRKTLLTLFKHRDSVTRQDVMEEYERVHGEKCKLSDYIIRQQLREVAEKIEDGGQTIYVVKGAMQTR